ncbi:RagB/SusD family nutrient uptake outer membrane protein [Olivibacter ginsenosidimutans]
MKLKYHIIALIAFACTFSSCEKDLLTKNPLDSPSSETFFSNQTEIDIALTGAYRSFYWHSQRVPYILWLDASTDIAWSRGDFGSMLTAQGGQYTTETDLFYEVWTHMFTAIAKANNILDNMERAVDVVSPEYYADAQAQARFLRAYFYTYLIGLYGDVPWVDHILELSNAHLPRTPKAEVLQHIYEDLDFAAENLPTTRPSTETGKVTKGAALALKARAALWLDDFQTAAEAAKAVMDLGVYELYPSYQDLFQYKGADSKESILSQHYNIDVFVTQVPRYLANREAAGYSALVPTQTLVDMYRCTDGKPIDESPLYNPLKPFEHRDPRLDQSIVIPGEWINGLWFQTHPDSTKTFKQTANGITRVNNVEVTNAYATFTGYLWNKYMDEADLPENITQSSLPVMMIRYAEVLLTYAEAKIERNEIDQSVVDAINQVRQRVGMPPVSLAGQEEMRNTVRYERTVELALEGFRLFDIRRWHIAEHVMPGNVLGRRQKAHWFDPITPDIDPYGHPIYPNESTIFQIISVNQFRKEKNYLWPIPQREINIIPELTQNPGY